MRHDQSVDTQVDNSNNVQKKNLTKQTSPDDGGSNWQFKFVMTVIGCGVLGLVLKMLGVL